MNETFVTLSGWLGGDVTIREAAGVPVATFRVASTPRRYQRKTETWEDGDTQWYSVNAWRPSPRTATAPCGVATPWWSTASSAPTSGPTRPASR